MLTPGATWAARGPSRPRHVGALARSRAIDLANRGIRRVRRTVMVEAAGRAVQACGNLQLDGNPSLPPLASAMSWPKLDGSLAMRSNAGASAIT